MIESAMFLLVFAVMITVVIILIHKIDKKLGIKRITLLVVAPSAVVTLGKMTYELTFNVWLLALSFYLAIFVQLLLLFAIHPKFKDNQLYLPFERKEPCG